MEKRRLILVTVRSLRINMQTAVAGLLRLLMWLIQLL